LFKSFVHTLHVAFLDSTDEISEFFETKDPAIAAADGNYLVNPFSMKKGVH
jgi:hypothetical protein